MRDTLGTNLSEKLGIKFVLYRNKIPYSSDLINYYARTQHIAAHVYARVEAPCDARLAIVVVATMVGDLNKSQWQTDYDSEWR